MGNKQLSFKTNVLLKNILGQDLINDDNIAVMELVKNSFDAGSKDVKVIFKNLLKNDDNTNHNSYSDLSSKLIIIDTGKGMDINDISNKWLNIAYSEKKAKFKEGGRVLAGNKGIGRFSCDRLGRYLDLYTRKKLEKDILHLKISWEDFETDGIDNEIQNVKINYKIVYENEIKQKYGLDSFSCGTIIEINKLKSNWLNYKFNNKLDKIKLLSLKRQLEKLINPNQIYSKNKFNIELTVPDITINDEHPKDERKINGLIRNKIFKKLEYMVTYIQASISQDGRIISTTLYDRNKEIFKIDEKNESYPLLKNIKIYIYYLNSYSKAYFTKKTDIQPVNFGSIFLFINGFRVSPLGDPGNDWLRLETRKGQGYARYLGTREILGRIEIIDEKNVFRITSSREGLVENNEKQQLLGVSFDDNKGNAKYDGFYFKTHKRLERYIVDGLGWDKTEIDYLEIERAIGNENWSYDPKQETYSESQFEKEERIILIAENIILQDTHEDNIIDFRLNEDLFRNHISEKNKKAFEKIIKLAKRENVEFSFEKLEKIEKELGKAKKENELRQKQAGTLEGLLSHDQKDFAYIIHHIKILASSMKMRLKNFEKKYVNSDRETKIALARIILDNYKVLNACNVFLNTDKKVVNYKKEKVNIATFFEEYIESLNEKRLKIDVFNNTATLPIIKCVEYDLVQIIENVIDNSCKNSARKLEIYISDINEPTIKICFRDDGNGLPDISNINVLFDIGYTTKMYGNGLGLSHVKMIVEGLEGKVFVNEAYENGFELIVELNREI
jgi:signal transduction histidine kinase